VDKHREPSHTISIINKGGGVRRSLLCGCNYIAQSLAGEDAQWRSRAIVCVCFHLALFPPGSTRTPRINQLSTLPQLCTACHPAARRWAADPSLVLVPAVPIASSTFCGSISAVLRTRRAWWTRSLRAPACARSATRP